MSQFERDGVDRQMEAENVRQAVRAFNYSCNKCCYTGKHILCENCAISCAHDNAMKRLGGDILTY